VSTNRAENVVRVLTHPIVISLLITIAMLGIIVELRTPGFGIAGGLGIASLGLFLRGHWLVQLGGWEEHLLAVVGVALLALEVFVIPGFGLAGIPGIPGILAIATGLVLSMVGAGATAELMMFAAVRVVLALLVAVVASLVLLRILPRLPFGRRLILRTELHAARGCASAPQERRAPAGQARADDLGTAPGRHRRVRGSSGGCRLRR